MVLVLGSLAALVTRALVPAGCNMWLGMALGMGIGMLVLVTVGTVLQVLFGGMEVMVPGALSGMLTGMVVGMLSCVESVTAANALLLGVGIGLICMAFVYGMNAYLTRDGHSWTT